MRKIAEVESWRFDTSEAYGDPSLLVCQLFLRWEADLEMYAGEDLVCGMIDGRLAISPGNWLDGFLPIEVGEEARFAADGALEAFEAERITAGVWALSPSLNIPGEIHGFLVLYDVPEPPPWQQRIVVVGAAR